MNYLSKYILKFHLISSWRITNNVSNVRKNGQTSCMMIWSGLGTEHLLTGQTAQLTWLVLLNHLGFTVESIGQVYGTELDYLLFLVESCGWMDSSDKWYFLTTSYCLVQCLLLAGKCMVNGSDYTEHRCFSPDSVTDHRQSHCRARAYHETVDDGLKNCNVVYHIFNHDLSMHCAGFHAVAKVTAIIIETSD